MVPIWLAALVWLLAVFGTAVVVALCSIEGRESAYQEGYQDGRRAASHGVCLECVDRVCAGSRGCEDSPRARTGLGRR